MKVVAFVFAAFVLTGCESKPNLSCAIIHEPKAGCPQGYKRESSPRFTEKDGSKRFACASEDQAKEGCVDFIDAGESMALGFHIEIPENGQTSGDNSPVIQDNQGTVELRKE